MKRLRYFILFISIFLILSCSRQNPEYAKSAAFGGSDIDIAGGDGVTIRVTGIKGEKGDAGERGEIGPQGPQGPGGGGSEIGSDIWVNVKGYGVIGDGKADDTEKLKELMATLPARSTLKFPVGIYKITDTLVNSKNLIISGSGVGTKIYQSADKTLMEITSSGFFRVENIWLASAARSSGTCLIKASANASHCEFEDVYITGSYFGLAVFGVLFPRFDNIMEGDPWNSALYPTYTGKAGIYGEYYGGRAENAVTIINPVFQGGWDRAVWIRDHNETGVSIIGGCLEAMKEAAVVLDGVSHFVNIIGTHFEGTEGTIQLNSCAQVNINGVLGIGRYGIILKNCRRVGIEETYAWALDVDNTNWNVTMENIFYKTLKLGARMVNARNFNCTDNVSLGPFGTYTSDWPDSIVDGTLENWVSGKPMGFSTFGTITQESNIVFEGKYAAKVKWSQIAGLCFDVPARYLKKGGVITVIAMCYKPTGGFNPRIAAIYNDWSSTTIFPVIELKENEWEIIRATFNVPPNQRNMKIVVPSGYSYGKEGQELIVDWITVAPSH